MAHFMTIHPILVKIFHSAPQMPSSWWRWRRSQGITKIGWIYPLGTVNVSAQFHGNRSNSC